MENRSRKSARYGALAERAARDRYGLETNHTSWCDATAPDGTPVKVKAAMMNRASGSVGRFRIFEKYHRKLSSRSGAYVFVAYEAAGAGIRVKRMRSLEASSLSVDWYGAGGHRDSNQVKIRPSAVFGGE